MTSPPEERLAQSPVNFLRSMHATPPKLRLVEAPEHLGGNGTDSAKAERDAGASADGEARKLKGSNGKALLSQMPLNASLFYTPPSPSAETRGPAAQAASSPQNSNTEREPPLLSSLDSSSDGCSNAQQQPNPPRKDILSDSPSSSAKSLWSATAPLDASSKAASSAVSAVALRLGSKLSELAASGGQAAAAAAEEKAPVIVEDLVHKIDR